MSNGRHAENRGAVKLRPLSYDRVRQLKDRRIGEVDDDRARRARAAATRVVAWNGMTFYYDATRGVMVRDGLDGTHGWQYGTVADLDLDWHEIEQVGRVLATKGDAEIWTPNQGDR